LLNQISRPEVLQGGAADALAPEAPTPGASTARATREQIAAPSVATLAVHFDRGASRWGMVTSSSLSGTRCTLALSRAGVKAHMTSPLWVRVRTVLCKLAPGEKVAMAHTGEYA